jgi:hypothetical protein
MKPVGLAFASDRWTSVGGANMEVIWGMLWEVSPMAIPAIGLAVWAKLSRPEGWLAVRCQSHYGAKQAADIKAKLIAARNGYIAAGGKLSMPQWRPSMVEGTILG